MELDRDEIEIPQDSSWLALLAPQASVVSNDVLLSWEGASVFRAYDNDGGIVATFTAENLAGVDIAPNGNGNTLYYNGEFVAASSDVTGPNFRLAGIDRDDALVAAGQ